ncbi:hypothetical protein [Streptomyces sp. NPDC047061]|uniref:hypothetical protein n=1 Tax=Streptomyces sp. NPDC047061 TaxID=3154605 RepID=UPI0033C0DDB2
MSGLLKQLRVSLLITLGFSAYTSLGDLVSGLMKGNFLATLGDRASGALAVCVLVAAVHSVIYGAMHFGRPETREARGVRAGIGLLLALDVAPLLTTGYVVLALVPLLAVVGGWSWGRYKGSEADAARWGALVFGVLSLFVQGVVALVMSIAGWL